MAEAKGRTTAAREERRRVMKREVVDGLQMTPKTIPSKYFYDREGSLLFDEITELDEYYPTRTELSIMEAHVEEMAAAIGEDAVLVEFGSGSSRKTMLLLEALESPAGYIPVDISGEHLLESVDRLRGVFPDLHIAPVVADYTSRVRLPVLGSASSPVVIYFPGSTIGNFHPPEASSFLRSAGRTAGPGGSLLLGVDLVKDVAVLEAAYNDVAGVTAAFNRNILLHINAVLSTNFDPQRFAHRAVFNVERSRIEMHLVSKGRQHVRVGGRTFEFADGEYILTEVSYKYTLDGLTETLEKAGFETKHIWTDVQSYFAVAYGSVGP